MKQKLSIMRVFFASFISILSLSAQATQITSETPENREIQINSTNQPTFVMIHSAWMGGWSFNTVGKMLTEQGYAYKAPDLPAHGEDKTPVADVSLDAYVKTVTDVIDEIKGPVMLVGHSFGGVVASQVAEERPEQVLGIHYLCAFMLPNSTSFMDAVQGVTNSKVLNNLVFSEDKSLVGIKEEAIHEAVAHDVPEADFLATKPYLVLEPTKPLGEKLVLTDNRYGRISRFYTSCSEDSAIPLYAQKAMMETLPVEKSYTLTTSHAPIFSMPGKVVDVLIDSANLATK